MQIKKFEAQSVPEALKQIKQEFGSEAVILSVRKMENGRRVFGLTKANGVEVTAATDVQPAQEKNSYSKSGYARYQDYQYSRPDSDISGRKKSFIKSFRSGTKRFERRTDASVRKKHKRNRDAKELYASYCQMLEQDVDENIALELIREVSRFASANSYLCRKGVKSCMIQILDEKGVSAGRVKISKDKQKRIAVVGPTGVGKTTTIAKLAAAAKTRQKRQRVALITLDQNRIGAIEQIKVYAKIIGVPVRAASNKKELKKYLEKLNHYDMIFIDTPGVSQTKQEQLHEVKDLFSKIPDIEFHLVLSAATNEKTLKDVMEKFKIFQVRRLMFTKLDESVTYGSMLNQLYRTRIPVSYFTNGQNVPEDIEAATIEKLTELLFKGKDEKKFLAGSPEELARNIIAFERLLNGSEDEYEKSFEYDKIEKTGRYIAGPNAFVEKRFSGYRC